MQRKKQGFSLIELLIVVAIILIIAAIAIPNLLRSRISANEASAVGSLRTYNTAMITYISTYPNVGYAGTLAALGPPSSGNATSAAAGLIDNVLGSGTAQACKAGYCFNLNTTVSGTVNVTYTLNADPQAVGSTGNRYFFTDGSAVIRVNQTSTASATDPPL
jgi:prepilin-type N-terminal cleavage/methylation domain-containing protein